MKWIGSIIITLCLIRSVAYAQNTPAPISLPDLSKTGVASEQFQVKATETLSFVEKTRMNFLQFLKNIQKNNSKEQVVEKPSLQDVVKETTMRVTEEIDPTKTVKAFNEGHDKFLALFISFAIFIVSRPIFFYGIILIFILLFVRTLMNR